MKSKSWQLKTSVFVLVIFLALLVPLASLAGWHTLQQIMLGLNDANVAAPDGVSARIAYASYILLATSVLGIVLACIVCMMLSRRVFNPLLAVSEAFERVAGGDLAHHRDLSERVEAGPLHRALKKLHDMMGHSVGQVRAGMKLISAEAQHIVTGNTELGSRIEQQAAALQQTAASMEELASTVKQNADNARQANQLAVTASEVAHRGGGAVGEVVSTMQDISESSRKISDIVGVIDSIAFQTNILALNAAVEAARAGEQGKGFAVVASEVRALAQRSAHAAREIKDLIDDSAKRVAEGSEQVERAGATMEEIVTSVARVTDIMGEISAATTEQSSGIDQINIVVTQMDGVTQQNARLIEEGARAAKELVRHVTYVGNAVAKFKLADHQVIDITAIPGQAPANSGRRLAGAPAPARGANGKKALAPAQTAGSARRLRDESREMRPPSRPPARLAAAAGAGAAAEPLLRPSFDATSGGQPGSAEDEWEEF